MASYASNGAGESLPPDDLLLDIDSVVKVVQCPVMLNVY